MKLLFNNSFRFTDEQINRIRDLGYDITLWEDNNSLDSYDYEVVVGNGQAFNINISKLNKLKMIQLTTAGFDKLPLDEIKDRKIKLANAKGVYSIPIAEFTILKIFEIYKKSREFENNQRNKEWTRITKLKELYGKTVGIMGTGSIATEIAIRAKAFGCKVIGMNTSGKDIENFDKVYRTEDINNLLKDSDIIISTLPLNDKTRNMINKDRLNHMKADGILINISRGGIINEEDLIEHLEEGKLMGVALDVFEKEPLPKDSPLWNHPKVFITPHNSYASDNIKNRAFELIYFNLKAFIEDKELKNLV